MLPEADGHTFKTATSNHAFKPPPDQSTAGVEEGHPHVLTTGMGGTRHMERLRSVRALKRRRD